MLSRAAGRSVLSGPRYWLLSAADPVEEALEQIERKGYVQEYISHDIPESHILKYGIAFCGKKVVVKFE